MAAVYDKDAARSMVVLHFLEELSPGTKTWLLNKLTVARLKYDVVEGTNDQVYHVIAEDFRVFEEASLLGFVGEHQPDIERLGITEKQYIIIHEITSIRFLWDDIQCKDLPVFYRDQSIFSECKKDNILTYFPVHSPDKLKKLEGAWLMKALDIQPIEEIRSYFGDSIAMYFSFLGFYIKCLTVPAIVGLMFHLLSFFLEVNVAFYFSIFNVIWCTVFFALWRRKSTSLAYKWGSLNFTRFDKPRPEFRGEKIEEDPITHKMEPVGDYKSKYYKFFFVSLPVIIVFLTFSVFLGFLYFYLEDYICWMNNPNDHLNCRQEPLSIGFWLASQCLTAMYGILSYALDLLYRNVASTLNNWENHRFQQGYDNFLIAKLVVFSFVNYFHTLFYIAFYMRDFKLLRKNLATLLIVNQIVQEVIETLFPYLKYKTKKRSNLKGSNDVGQENEKVANPNYQIMKDLAKEEYINTLDDFLELFFQFGYVFLFSAVYPLAAFWGFIGSLLEMKLDAFKFCFVNRKPNPQMCDGIGTWLMAFELLGIMAVITNCFLVALNEDIMDYFKSSWHFDEMNLFFTFVIIEHVLLFIQVSIRFLVPSTPHWVKIKLAERDYEAYKTLKNEVRTSLEKH